MSSAPSQLSDVSSMQSKYSTVAATTLVAVGLTGLALVIWTLWWMKNGFDITDESFYLLWIQDPGNYTVAGSQFGSVYQPLYYLLGQDAVSLRRVNFLITITLGTVLCALALKQAFRDSKKSKDSEFSPRWIWVLSFAIASTSATIYLLWLTTPNYNILTFQGLIVVAIGLIMATKDLNWKSLIGWILLSSGGWLVFLAKPTSALVVAIVSLVVLISTRKFSLKPALIAVGSGVAFALITAFVISGSVSGFIARVTDGATAINLMGGHGSNEFVSTLLNKFWFGLQSPLPFLLVATVVAVGTYIGIRYAKAQVPIATVSVLAAVAVFLILLLHPSTVTPLPVVSAATFLGLLIGAICGVLFGRTRPKSDESDSSRRAIQRPRASVALATAFIFFPFCYFIGTNNVPMASMAGASFFWVLSAVACVTLKVDDLRKIVVVGFVIVIGQFLTALTLNQAFVNPYRSEATVAESNSPVLLLSSGSTVHMNEHNAEYFEKLKETANNYGFNIGDSLIELTGQTPGAALAIGAKPVGSPWLLGGYPGSTDFVEFLFGKTPCDSIEVPWIITAPNSTRAVLSSTLHTLGIDFPNDYERVGAITSNKSTGIQFLWKPTKTPNEMLNSCEQSRVPDQQRKESAS